MFGGFPAKKLVYTPHIYGSGQPYSNRIEATSMQLSVLAKQTLPATTNS
jgi:hypothetical protein